MWYKRVWVHLNAFHSIRNYDFAPNPMRFYFGSILFLSTVFLLPWLKFLDRLIIRLSFYPLSTIKSLNSPSKIWICMEFHTGRSNLDDVDNGEKVNEHQRSNNQFSFYFPNFFLFLKCSKSKTITRDMQITNDVTSKKMQRMQNDRRIIVKILCDE